MPVDMSQFNETFLEEAVENISDLEAGLLELEAGDQTDLNAIFRAAHSLKGGASTFGFSDIADFTHVLETLLDKARDGDITITSPIVDVLLQSVDVLNNLVEAARGDAEAKDYQPCLKKLESFLTEGDEQQEETHAPQTAEAETHGQGHWHITFYPKPHFPLTGNDPIMLLKELKLLGECTIKPLTDKLPKFDELTPEYLYLGFDVILASDCSQDDIDDVFMFVEDDAHITIKHEEDAPTETAEERVAEATSAQASTAKEEVLEAEPFEDRRQGDRRSTDRRQQNTTAQNPGGGSLRVATEKVDMLIDMVGELVTTNAMVLQASGSLQEESAQKLTNAINDMNRHTRTLQEAIMAIRMLPISFAFNRFPRMIRDTAQKLGKKVDLITAGDQTELDKTVIERISDPLTHIVRNAVDHGIESPEDRRAIGKPETATVKLNAFYKGGTVVIEVSDDGRGLDPEKLLKKALEKGVAQPHENYSNQDIYHFIFEPGFSTAQEVTDVSGRGVGMDIVMKNIKALGGSVAIETELGKGSTFSISLPLTLAIVDGMAVRVGAQTYIIPLLSIIESLYPTDEMLYSVNKEVQVLNIRGTYIPLLQLEKVFHNDKSKSTKSIKDGIAVIVESEDKQIALFVDELLGERQVVIKSVEKNYKAIEGISGATILGDGTVSLILDLPGIVQIANREGLYNYMPTHKKQTHDATSLKG